MAKWICAICHLPRSNVRRATRHVQDAGGFRVRVEHAIVLCVPCLKKGRATRRTS
jgi:hypothetical protein